MKVLGDALQVGSICVGHAQGGADLADVPGWLGEQRRGDAVGVVLGKCYSSPMMTPLAFGM
ncbi:hypothetical protein [Streptomyces sp. NPDC002758]